jgi:hypothetical protein
MRECRTYGSVRGVGGNAHPYRDSSTAFVLANYQVLATGFERCSRRPGAYGPDRRRENAGRPPFESQKLKRFFKVQKNKFFHCSLL